ncbi:NAD+ synthase [Alloalcanivorax venustensis]|jgi:NAD+ synthase (glutamine-hydrolysing)|uniref:NAD+ synthase n=1 Tax=Alloalcanivorax TaxID=3020832 RepID=UPI000E886BB5|nr:NAD+ synthase [Alloalcanivorax venustensis]MBA4731934.1 NAD+ synthase [Alcanivorax sp.]MED5601937.1 NAD+ synthase [Pseudomonadota bacterium]MCH2551710.1 NAD+ synthase [Alcanivorax sp.]HAD62508.1 NAD+ synthase [Alcanivorax sp.]HAI24575.1 NAD+ synthase [Alcanivorax sp.]
MRVVMAQRNPLVGDIEGNADAVVAAAREARNLLGAELVVFPELVLTGYPPEDLLLRPSLNGRVDDALAHIGERIEVPVVLGYPAVRNGVRRNAAGVLFPGDSRPRHEYFKQCLPNYRVFDEKRYFQPGDQSCVFELGRERLAITICEDIWFEGPAAQAARDGATCIVNLNASPFRAGKPGERRDQVCARARETGLPVLYCNLVGGQDELVFDGASFVVDGEAGVCVQGASFEEALVPVDLGREGGALKVRGEVLPVPEDEESLYRALVLATRDYVNKNGFKGALLGLSGGIDSALTLAVAVDALGPDRVEAVMMPFRYTADISIEDAEQQAKALRVHYRSLPIEPAFNGFMSILEEAFADHQPDTTEENLQARCRGVLLMALSNKNGSVVLTTGNKSEMAVGYATLYGDMAGGFSVLKDVFKTWVYRVARWRNQKAGSEIIPERVITRPPSAELAPDQVDSDSLPGYDELDAILERYVEQDMSAEAVIRDGFDRDTVYRVVKLTDRNEYKRRQAAVGPRVSRRAFGKDRRYPITNGWRPGD